MIIKILIVTLIREKNNKNVFDKGHKNQFSEYINAISNGHNSPIDLKK